LHAVTGALHNPLVKVPGAVDALKHGLGKALRTTVKHRLEGLPLPSGLAHLPAAIPSELPKALPSGLPVPRPSRAVNGLTNRVPGALNGVSGVLNCTVNGATGAVSGAASGPVGGWIAVLETLLGAKPKAPTYQHHLGSVLVGRADPRFVTGRNFRK
jgi:hypothetical protein